MEDGGGGGRHFSSTALGLGISAPPPNTPQFSEFFVWGCFILRDQTTGDLKSHHLQARVTLTALSVPQGHIFFQQSCNVIFSNLSQLCITVYTRVIIECVKNVFLWHSWSLRGARAPKAPLGSGTGIVFL